MCVGATSMVDDTTCACVEADAVELFRSVSVSEFWSDCDGSVHSYEFLTSLYTGTWFSIEGVPGIVEARSGSLAGTTLADLVFTLSVSKIFR